MGEHNVNKLENAKAMRRILIRALGTLGSQKTINVILTYANDEGHYAWKDVAEALQKLCDESGD